jgi:nicotinamidase/pyrazinamidase
MAAIGIDRATDILGLVDVQPTFMPGGELPVADGDAVVPMINRLMRAFDHAFATQDWHPLGHSSFASAHPGRKLYDTISMPYGDQVLWPDHALQNSVNAALHRELDVTKVEVIIRKGFHRDIDSYSTFFENDRRTATGLGGWLRERNIRRVFEDACRGIGVPLSSGRTTMDDARERLAHLGVRTVNSEVLAA